MQLPRWRHSANGRCKVACEKTCRGAAVLEFAVTAPVFFLMVLGLIELGRGIMLKHVLTNAAQQGCRVGVVEGKANSDVTTAVNASLSILGITSDTTTVQVNDGSSDVVNANPGDEVTVIVTVPVSKVTWLPGGKYLSGNLSGQYTLRRE
jgi:Flp pilus assembly protein TadG